MPHPLITSFGPDSMALAGPRRAILAATRTLGLVAILTAVPCAFADKDARSVSESRPASPEGRVRVETVSGSLDVSGWSEDRVEVTGTLDTRATLTLESSGDLVSVTVEWPKKIHFQLHDAVCDLRVRIPARGSLQVQVVSAQTGITGIAGAVEVESVSGGVTISGDPKRVDAQTVSGRLDINAGAGRCKAEAVSGEVTIRAAGGEVEGSTVSGQITVGGGPFERVNLEVVSGDIEFEGKLTPDAEVDISDHSGSVDFTLQGQAAGEFEVSTFSGDIHSDFGGEPRRASKWAPGEEYKFTVGSGGPRISIDVFSGSVRLRKP
jgi:hypothetical protein